MTRAEAYPGCHAPGALRPGAATLVAGCGGGERLAGDDLPRAPAALRVSSPAFTEGSRLPQRYTCDGAGDEPKVKAGTVPPSTSELVLVVSDPDAPGGTYVNLTRYGPARAATAPSTTAQRGPEQRRQGRLDPTLPAGGDAPHRYVWSVYALRDPSGLDAGAEPDDVAAALRDGVLAAGTITARYGR